MILLRWNVAQKFILKHRFSNSSLKRWRNEVQNAEWKNFADVRNTFSSADWVNGKIVFNVSGNKYRVIAVISFEKKKVYIRQVLTHEEYNQGSWKKKNQQ